MDPAQILLYEYFDASKCRTDNRSVNWEDPMRVMTYGIDLAKEVFQICGVSECGQVKIERKLSSRKKFSEYFANHEVCNIYFETCGGSNYWQRELVRMGHKVRQIPVKYVKPFCGRQKNDRNDAQAILAASTSPNTKFSSGKEIWQQDLQAVLRIREALIRDYVATGNQIRGLLLEYGVSIAKGHSSLVKNIPLVLEDCENQLTSVMREIIGRRFEHYLSMKAQSKEYLNMLESLSRQNEVTSELKKLPGIGVVSATAFVSTVGRAKDFKNGRQLAAFLGLVPRQRSSGGKTKLLGITKTGDTYTRQVIIQGMKSVLFAAVRKAGDRPPDHPDIKILEMLERKGNNKCAVALANRTVRKMWLEMLKLQEAS